MSKQHRWMRWLSYDLLSIPEFFKDDALMDHSYKSYNPQIVTSLKILKCVLMCRASGKWIQHDSTIPNLVLGHVRILVMVAGLKYGLPAFWLRSSFGPWFTEVYWGHFRHLEGSAPAILSDTSTLDPWNYPPPARWPEALRFLAHAGGWVWSSRVTPKGGPEEREVGCYPKFQKQRTGLLLNPFQYRARAWVEPWPSVSNKAIRGLIRVVTWIDNICICSRFVFIQKYNIHI